jgi:DNA-binding protein YbaB
MDQSAFTAARAAVSGVDNELTEKLRVAQDMMRQVAGVFDELKATEVTGQDPDGAVRVTVSGLGELRSVYIPPRTMQMLDGAGISAAVREALTQARLAAAAAMQKKMTTVTGESAVPYDKVDVPADPLQGLREAVPDGGSGHRA